MLILAKNTFSVNTVCHFLQLLPIIILRKKGVTNMTISQLKQIISNLPDETPILLSTEDIYELELVKVVYHSDGRMHLVLDNLE